MSNQVILRDPKALTAVSKKLIQRYFLGFLLRCCEIHNSLALALSLQCQVLTHIVICVLTLVV